MILGAMTVLSLLAKDANFFTDSVRKYIVEPNQIVRERSYMQLNIHSTLAAYDLDKVTIKDYAIIENAKVDADDPALRRRLKNIPVWDREVLGGLYEELQGIRTYYSFPTIDVDRYSIENSYRQVYLGAKRSNLQNCPNSPKTGSIPTCNTRMAKVWS